MLKHLRKAFFTFSPISITINRCIGRERRINFRLEISTFIWSDEGYVLNGFVIKQSNTSVKFTHLGIENCFWHHWKALGWSGIKAIVKMIQLKFSLSWILPNVNILGSTSITIQHFEFRVKMQSLSNMICAKLSIFYRFVKLT